jgi:hypothetical protein
MLGFERRKGFQEWCGERKDVEESLAATYVTMVNR